MRTMLSRNMALLTCTLFLTACDAMTVHDTIDPARKEMESLTVPGVVVSHLSKSTGCYVGSPAIAVAPNGDYVTSHDLFGENAPLTSDGRTTYVFRSEDKGETWTRVSVIDGLFWANLFFLNDTLYALGVNQGHGNIVIMKSEDHGESWTKPVDRNSGLLFVGAYHTAPTPVVIGKCRIWRAMENADAIASDLPIRYGALIISADLDKDLLRADSWTMSNTLPADSSHLDGEMRGWLEGNAVVGPDGDILNVMRVHVWPGTPEYAAILHVTDDGSRITFADSDYVPFAGGAKKFTIRYDARSGRYWTLSNDVLPDFESDYPASVRNSLVLMSSPDLREWTKHRRVLYHSDVKRHAFQYVDWVVEADDIVFVSRTSYDDETGGAASAHDANFLTFHRIRSFRNALDEFIE